MMDQTSEISTASSCPKDRLHVPGSRKRPRERNTHNTNADANKGGGTNHSPSVPLAHEYDSTFHNIVFQQLFHSLRTKTMQSDASSSRQQPVNLSQFWKELVGDFLRTSIVVQQGKGISLYRDSFQKSNMNPSNEYLYVMLNLHPEQLTLEKIYSRCRSLYCFALFLKEEQLLNDQYIKGTQPTESESTFNDAVNFVEDLVKKDTDFSSSFMSSLERQSAVLPSLLEQHFSSAPLQVAKKYQRILHLNSTIANAYLQRFQYQYSYYLTDIQYKKYSAHPKHERITLFHQQAPNLSAMKPSAAILLNHGPRHLVANHMIKSFWDHLNHNGYHVTESLKNVLTPELQAYFLSGIVDPSSSRIIRSIPHQSNETYSLRAEFVPNNTYPLSIYLVGKPGSGKSSLVRHFPAALQAAIQEHADPEVLVRFVKLNLNKPFKTLEMEFDLRPNNNDMSVMGIIQSRRLSRTQPKPGLVVVGMEEMAGCRVDSDPNQSEIVSLISQRFSGKKGIAHDSAIIPIFSSNYELEAENLDSLQEIPMFRNLKVIQMEGLSGRSRKFFAGNYLKRIIEEDCSEFTLSVDVDVDITGGTGDVRPLIQFLRIVKFYFFSHPNVSCLEGQIRAKVSVFYDGVKCLIESSILDNPLELVHRQGALLFPIGTSIHNPKSLEILERLRSLLGLTLSCYKDLCVIFDMWLSGTLAPTVILSRDRKKMDYILSVLDQSNGIQTIHSVDTENYKMARSLYDSNSTRNLRDDIASYGTESFIAVGLHCRSMNGQMNIREIIEDTPSMTAFSSERSALRKDGLLLCVAVEGVFSDELLSRASITI